MGRTIHNIENVLKAADILVVIKVHFSPRRSVSTSGLVPQLKRFFVSPIVLGSQLNATTNEKLDYANNRKFNLNLLLGTKRGASIQNISTKFCEYVMLAGVNDSVKDAKRLIDLVQGIPCKINLISFNPHSGSVFKPTKKEKIIEFRNILAEAGCVVLFRWSRGDDQMAACGQLGKPGEIQAPLLRVPSQFQALLEAAA
ncbi:dual-specificity RNA methyltransferase RlmN [Capsicum chacoense]